MNRLRSIYNSVKNFFVGENAAQRLRTTASLIWLGLFALTLVLQVGFNLPAALTPALALLPHGTLVALTFLGFCCSTLGTKRGLAAAAVALAVVAPLVQPLVGIPAIVVFAAGVTYLAVSRGFNRPVLTFLVSLPLAFILYLALAVVVAPAVHFLTLNAWSALSVVLAVVVAAGATALVASRIRDKRADADALPPTRVGLVVRGVTLLVLWATVPLLIWGNRSDFVTSLQLRHSMNPTQLKGLPETVQDRMLPRPTAETYMQNLNDDYMTSVEAPHLQQRPNGGLWWQSAVHNENRWGRIFGSSTRVVAVDADRTDSHSEETPASGFVFSDKSWVTKAVFAVRHPFSHVAETCYYQNSDSSWSLLLSYQSKRIGFGLPLPGTMIPTFAGVMEVTQNGVIRDWTVGQAAEQFPGAVLYPTELFRQQAEAYARWREGWTGSKILQQNVFEISEDTSPDALLNKQPYVQNLKDHGLQLTVSFEPLGDKQWALTEMLFCDAQTGQLKSATPPKGLIGPRQARLNVRSSDTRIDWSRIRKVEPRLVVQPRGVFWLVAIVTHWENEPDRHPYITSVLVDARTATDCYTFQHAKEMNEFLAQPRPVAEAPVAPEQ
jgi:hypothetical protein